MTRMHLQKKNLKLIKANKEDLKIIYGYDIKYDFEAWILYSGEVKIGVGGYVIKNGQNTLFLNILNPTILSFYSLGRYIKRSLLLLRSVTNGGFAVIQDEAIKNSSKFLTFLGFRYAYTVHNERIWLDYEV